MEQCCSEYKFNMKVGYGLVVTVTYSHTLMRKARKLCKWELKRGNTFVPFSYRCCIPVVSFIITEIIKIENESSVFKRAILLSYFLRIFLTQPGTALLAHKAISDTENSQKAFSNALKLIFSYDKTVKYCRVAVANLFSTELTRNDDQEARLDIKQTI